MDFSNFLGTLERYLDMEFAAYTNNYTSLLTAIPKKEDTILDCNQSATNESIAPLLTTNNACGKRICVFLTEIKSPSVLFLPMLLKGTGLKITDSRSPVMMTGQIFFWPDKPGFWLVK